MDASFDVIVVGAGAGGLLTAARLARLGYRTLVAERLAHLGGRASTRDVDGFKVNNGAIVIETGGITEQTFAEVGATFDVRTPDPPILYRVGGRDIDVTGGGWGFLLSRLTRHGARVLAGLAEARRDEGLPDGELSTADWLARFTRNQAVHGVFRSMCGSVFAVGPDELPARVFLTYFMRKSAFRRFGFCPRGTGGLWTPLAAAITDRGGEVWLRSEVRSLTMADGLVSGAVIDRHGQEMRITAGVVISDVGPAATVRLLGPDNLPPEYTEAVKRADRPCAMISVNFASTERLLAAPGLLSFASTRRLCYAANFTATCPEMAPDGWHLYVGTAVPRPSAGDFDETAETALLLADLRDEIGGFDRAQILSTVVTRDDWPPQRAVAGSDLPPGTPVANLWNVGDGVKEYANGGITACAETAQIVAGQVAERYPAGLTPRP
jgi:phytoene dehydrogenase-like protein